MEKSNDNLNSNAEKSASVRKALTCKDCVHWQGSQYNAVEGKCKNPKVVGSSKGFESPDGGVTGLRAVGEFGHEGYFYSGPDFGCIHAEKKDN